MLTALAAYDVCSIHDELLNQCSVEGERCRPMSCPFHYFNSLDFSYFSALRSRAYPGRSLMRKSFESPETSAKTRVRTVRHSTCVSSSTYLLASTASVIM